MLYGIPCQERRGRALNLLQAVDIASRADFRPASSSGRERQRVFTIGTLAGLPSSITPQSIILGILFGVLTTTIAGVYPANKAAKLDPIEALRAE